MILLKFTVTTTLAENEYSLCFENTFTPEESNITVTAANAIVSILSDKSFTILLPKNIPNELKFGFYVDYHECAKLTSQINSSLSPEYYLSQIELSKSIKEKKRFPILHLSAADMLSGDRRIIHNIRYYNVMDSSIWNYYYSFQEAFSDKSFSHLCYIIKGIIINQLTRLYDLKITTEYADLNSRIITNNYTDPIGHGSYVSPFLFHSEWKMKQESDNLLKESKITNYKWRFLLVDDHAVDSITTLDNNPKTDKLSTDLLPTSKLSIVRNDLESLNGIHVSWRYLRNNGISETWIKGGAEDGNIEIWGVTSIKKALCLLHDHKFDIILLDYLLGDISLGENDFRQRGGTMDDESKKEHNQYIHSSSREYGYQLLKRIKKLQKDNPEEYVGPLGKQYFMFISAFTTAVDERLRAEGLNRSEEYWQIGEGACPTNTPELFKFRLLQLMDGRLKQTGIQDLSYDSIIKEVEGIFSPELKQMHLIRKLDNELRQMSINVLSHDINTIVEVVKDVFKPIPKDIPLLNDLDKDINELNINDELSYANIIKKVENIFVPDINKREKRIESIRKRAYKAYKTILGYHYDYFTLKMDEGRSLLVDSFLSGKDHMDALLEHLLQFVHLTAFGTVRQWSDIWEEYQSFVRTIGSNVSVDEIRDISGYIEQHIIDLKSN